MSNRYRLQGLFARGGMAEVFLGTATGEEGFEKQVAIKRVHPHLAQDARIAGMFLSEAKLATVLHHQNIVSVLDVGRGPEGLFIVMELIHGWDLGVVLETAAQRSKVFPPTLAAWVGTQVLAGLRHAYRKTHQGKPLIAAHRDISSSNVLLSTEGEVKVADFGIARLDAMSGGTEPGTFKGKLAYASPELLRGERANWASDQFALGVVLYEMLTGTHPFGEAENLMSHVEKLQSDERPQLPGIPGPIASAVQRMLSRLPQERFETPDAATEALAHYLATAGTPAHSDALAQFIHSLELPQPLSERTEPIQLRSDTVIRGSFSLHGQGSSVAPLDLENSEWQPTGAALDISGKLDQAASDKPTAVPAKAAPEAELELDHRPAITTEAVAGAAELQGPRKPKRRGGRLMFSTVALLILGAAGYFAFPKLKGKTAVLRATVQPLPVLKIESDPPGATVIAGESEIGTTPLYTENVFPKADIPLSLKKNGYRIWKGSFRGGEDTAVEVRLNRK